MARSRAQRIARAIDKHGVFITLRFKVISAPANSDEDWPDSPVPEPVRPADVSVKSIIVPVGDTEWDQVGAAGTTPYEAMQAFFKYDQDMNEVEFILHRGNTYRFMQQDAYEVGGDILVQQVLLHRVGATVLNPHG